MSPAKKTRAVKAPKIKAEKAKRTLYKVLVGGKSCHGGNTEWSLPTEKNKTRVPGEWMSVEGDAPLRMCSRGFHLTWAPAQWFKQGCEIFEVEVSETAGEDASDCKVLARHARLVRRVTDVAELASLGILTGEHRVTDKAPGGGSWLATGSAQVTATGSAQVTAYGSAQVKAESQVTIVVFDGNPKLELSGDAVVVDRREAYKHYPAKGRPTIVFAEAPTT
jgi:hypothetical protein